MYLYCLYIMCFFFPQQMLADIQLEKFVITKLYIYTNIMNIFFTANASRHSAGEIRYYKGLHVKHNPQEAERFQQDLDRFVSFICYVL